MTGAAIVEPADTEAERSVLGAVLLGGAEGSTAPLDAARAAGLNADDFYLAGHAILYTAAVALAERGIAPDVLAMSDELGAAGMKAAGSTRRAGEARARDGERGASRAPRALRGRT